MCQLGRFFLKDISSLQPIPSPLLCHHSFGNVAIPHANFLLARPSPPWSFDGGNQSLGSSFHSLHDVQQKNYVVCLSNNCTVLSKVGCCWLARFQWAFTRIRPLSRFGWWRWIPHLPIWVVGVGSKWELLWYEIVHLQTISSSWFLSWFWGLL